MRSGDPLISVIMPSYNCGKYIAEAITSVLNQTYQNWELLICDDGSTDDSIPIAKLFASSHERIKTFSNDRNRGAAFAKNLLIGKSNGEFIALMDADDVCDENRLLEQLHFIRENNLDACGTDYYTIDPCGRTLEKHINFKSYEEILWSAFHNFSFCNASLLIRKESLLQAQCYEEELKTEAEDIDMIFRFILLGGKIQTLNRFYYKYRQHDGNTSQRNRIRQKNNSYNVTKALISKVMGEECGDDFARFMKYFHRPDFRYEKDCALLFQKLLRLVSAVETNVLGHTFTNTPVKRDIAKKLMFLSLNQIRHDKRKCLLLFLRSVWFFPGILILTLRNKWKAAL